MNFAALRSVRPFSNVHWIFFAVMVATWEWLLFGMQCVDTLQHAHLVAATATVVLTLWASHLRYLDIPSWRRAVYTISRAISDVALLFVAVLVVAIPLTFVIPHYHCHTSRSKAVELVLHASAFRSQIEERAQKTKSLAGSGKGLEIKPDGRLKSGTITEDGVIVVAGDDPPAVIMFVPTMTKDGVKWQCIGQPAKHLPRMCRDEKE